MKACHLYHHIKKSHLVSPRFLKPLPIPFWPWNNISIDYVVNLPEYKQHGQKYKYILITICRLIKIWHYIPIVLLDTEAMADIFLQNIYRLYGVPETVISNRRSSFISTFICTLFQRLETTLQPSSTFYPQINRQTEIANIWMEQYLWVYVNFYQDNWVDWLSLAEFATNNQVSEATELSPFFANYSFHPHLGIESTKSNLFI